MIGHFNGKCLSIQIQTNRPQRLLFLETKTVHLDVFFNNFPVNSTHSQKHLGLILDAKLTFDSHLKEKIAKANKGIGTIKRLYNNLPRNALLSIYKYFIRPHLDYAYIIYDQPHYQSLSDRIESVQYNAGLAITGAIRGASRERLYQELGLESLSNREWYRRPIMYFNIASGKCPNYLTDNLLPRQTSYNTERNNLYYTYRSNTDYFKNYIYINIEKISVRFYSSE